MGRFPEEVDAIAAALPYVLEQQLSQTSGQLSEVEMGGLLKVLEKQSP